MRNRNKWVGVAQIAIALLLMVSAQAFGSTMLFDRGLPIATEPTTTNPNLNKAAGVNRSNVAWAEDTGFFDGDDFTIGSSGQTFLIESLTVWNIRSGDVGDISLFIGENGKSLDLAATIHASDTAYSITRTYSDSTTYQGSGGGFYTLYETTFTGLKLLVQGGVLYNFGVDGSGSGYLYNHASNAALSNTVQEGADGMMLLFNISDLSDYESWTSDRNVPGGFGWDKASDINVQVYGTVVPEPATMSLLGIGLAGLAIRRMRRRS